MPKLTKRQIEAIDLSRQGLRQTEIADRMHISNRQVFRILGDAREALDAKTNHELVAKAIDRGLLTE